MIKPKFSIGYNHEPEFFNLAKEFKKNISEIYFPIPLEMLGSGRNIQQKNKYKQEVFDLIALCEEIGVRSNLLINPTCEGKLIGNQEHMVRVFKYVSELVSKGLKSVTLLNPFYFVLFKKNIPSLELHASVNCIIDNIEKVDQLMAIGASAIVPNRDINLNLDLLLKIKQRGIQMKLMVNEGCIYGCTYRTSHFNYFAHNTEEKEALPLFCNLLVKKKPEIIFKSPFIRPEDINNYFHLVDEFKISSRTMSTQNIRLILNAYISQRHIGNLTELLNTKYPEEIFKFIDNKKLDEFQFFKKISTCNKNCDDCSFCKILLDECCVLK